MLEENDFSEAAILGQEWSGKFRSSDSFNEIERIHVRSDRDFSLTKFYIKVHYLPSLI